MSPEKGIEFYIKDIFPIKKNKSNKWTESYSNITELSKFFSFLNSFIKTGDLDTIQVGYSVLFNETAKILEDNKVPKPEICQFLLDLIEENNSSIILSINFKEIKITKESIKYLFEISNLISDDQDNIETIIQIITVMYNTSVICLKNEDYHLTNYCLNYIYKIKNKTFPLSANNIEESKIISFYDSYLKGLSIIGSESIKHENESIPDSIIKNITEIWDYYQRNNLSIDIRKKCLNSIGNMGISTIVNGKWLFLSKIINF